LPAGHRRSRRGLDTAEHAGTIKNPASPNSFRSQRAYNRPRRAPAIARKPSAIAIASRFPRPRAQAAGRARGGWASRALGCWYAGAKKDIVSRPMGSGRGVVGPDGDDTNALNLREIEDVVARRRLIFAVDHDELIPGRYTANLWSVVRVDVISGRVEFNPARRDPHVMTVSSTAQSELSRTQVRSPKRAARSHARDGY
jgi:hypothetical protein